jgi:transposase
VVNRKLSVAISDRTLRRRAHDLGFKWQKPVRKPMLTETNKRKRLAFARKYRNVTNWKRWVFSDEKTFTVGPSNMRRRVRQGQTVIQETVRHPAKVNCWFAINSDMTFRPYLFTENMTGQLYTTILGSNLRPPATGVWQNNTMFQHDRDPKHQSRVARQWLDDNHIRWVTDWPPQSPDLNPIENLWPMLSHTVARSSPSNVAQLRRAITKACREVSQSRISALIDSMDDRLAAVVRAKGGHTSY